MASSHWGHPCRIYFQPAPWGLPTGTSSIPAGTGSATLAISSSSAQAGQDPTLASPSPISSAAWWKREGRGLAEG